MASGLIVGSNLVSQRRLERDSFLASKKFQEYVVLWLTFFPLFRSTSTNSSALYLTICFYETWMGVVNYDVCQVGKLLFDTIFMWCAINKTKPTHRCPTLNSSLYFWWWNFITKGWITWSWMWSVSSLCGLHYISTWPSQACPFTWYPCFLRARPSGVSTFLQWVWNLQEYSLCCDSDHSCLDY